MQSCGTTNFATDLLVLMQTGTKESGLLQSKAAMREFVNRPSVKWTSGTKLTQYPLLSKWSDTETE